MIKKLFSLVLLLAACRLLNAQLVGIVHEEVARGPVADPVFNHPLPEGFSCYRIYAVLDDPDDRVSAVFGSNAPSPVHHLIIGSTREENAIWNHPNGGVLGTSLNCAFWDMAPSMQWDSYVTLGAFSSSSDKCVDCEGTIGIPLQVSTPPGALAQSLEPGGLAPDLLLTDGSWFLPNDGSCNALPQGKDNRVLIAQVAVPTGTLMYQINIAVFDGGVGSKQVVFVHTEQDPPTESRMIKEVAGPGLVCKPGQQ
jgi:hypothetical protein